MIVRDLKQTDISILRAMAQRAGYPYPDPTDSLELIRVVADQDDKPLMAAAGKKLVELFLWPGELERPHASVHALRLLHLDMAETLKVRGYKSAEAFLPPAIADKFGRRLETTFGWKRNWASYGRVL